jgi:putative chitinase
MAQENNFMGLNGFVWFFGVVENRDDPLKLGRVQARIFGWHTDSKMKIPTTDLPWAQPVFPTNSSTVTSTPKEGDMIFGFFTDGDSAQFPIFMGVLPGIPDFTPAQGTGFSDARVQQNLDGSPTKPYARSLYDNGVKLKSYSKTRYPRDLNQPTTSRLARNEDTANTVYQFRRDNWITAESTSGSTWKEPFPSYNAQYPFDLVLESESGHIMEFDDSAANERVMIAHRTGTTTEMYPSGTKLDKVVKDNYTIVHGSDFCYVNGKVELTVENVAKIRIKGSTTIEIDGDVNWKVGGDMNLSVGGNLNLKTAGNMTSQVSGNYAEVVGSRNEMSLGDSQIRHNSDLHQWIGGDFYDRRQSGRTNFACPGDVRSGSIDCGDVAYPTTANLGSPNSYNNPDEVQPIPEIVRTVIYNGQVDENTAAAPLSESYSRPVAPTVTPQVSDVASANVDSTGCFTFEMVKITASVKDPEVLQITDALNKACEPYSINTKLRKAHLLAQLSHESGGFKYRKEIWGPTAVQSRYEGRAGLGNTQPGDGERFMGRGYIQVTGRANYTNFANFVKLSLEDTIKYLETIEGAVMSAVWYWNTRNLNALADADDIRGITRRINGGFNGLDDRIVKYNKILPLST